MGPQVTVEKARATALEPRTHVVQSTEVPGKSQGLDDEQDRGSREVLGLG